MVITSALRVVANVDQPFIAVEEFRGTVIALSLSPV